jgi:hypothetical protein
MHLFLETAVENDSGIFLFQRNTIVILQIGTLICTIPTMGSEFDVYLIRLIFTSETDVFEGITNNVL